MTAEGQKKDIKEILEILAGLRVLGTAAAGILGDGKLGVSDIEKFITLAKEFDVLKSAIEDAGEAVREAKDIDQAEAAVLVASVFSLISSIKEAAKAAKAKA